MPQLIAMIIVVVGALIYMFQTFGGTGDKIEGIAQKSSVLTEISNVKNGLQLALRAGDIKAGTTLYDLAELDYFAAQMNTEISDNNGVSTAFTDGKSNVKSENAYSAISFGGEDNPSMIINLVTPTAADADARPGIRVEFTGTLSTNAGFLETQIASDLAAVADIDRATTNGGHVVTMPTDANEKDGILTIYYKDLPTGFITTVK